VTLQAGESVVLYTDGITEAENVGHKLYGIERLCEVISRHWDQSAEAIKQAVIDDVTRYIGQQKVYDDLTLVILKQQ
jgi:serine phosphatase RsbU (regulator of sigma subunit)